jgi:hypothetical protein
MAEGNKYQSHGSRANVPLLKASEASKSNEQVQTSTAFSTSLLFSSHPSPKTQESCTILSQNYLTRVHRLFPLVHPHQRLRVKGQRSRLAPRRSGCQHGCRHHSLGQATPSRAAGKSIALEEGGSGVALVSMVSAQISPDWPSIRTDGLTLVDLQLLDKWKLLCCRIGAKPQKPLAKMSLRT